MRAGKEALAKTEKRLVEDGEQTGMTTPISVKKQPSTRKRRSTTKTPPKQSTTASKSASSKRRHRIDDKGEYETPSKKRGKAVAVASAAPQVAQSNVASPGGLILAQGPATVLMHYPVVIHGPPPPLSPEAIRRQCRELSIADLEGVFCTCSYSTWCTIRTFGSLSSNDLPSIGRSYVSGRRDFSA